VNLVRLLYLGLIAVWQLRMCSVHEHVESTSYRPVVTVLVWYTVLSTTSFEEGDVVILLGHLGYDTLCWPGDVSRGKMDLSWSYRWVLLSLIISKYVQFVQEQRHNTTVGLLDYNRMWIINGSARCSKGRLYPKWSKWWIDGRIVRLHSTDQTCLVWLI